jgi:hypothetical protein
MKVLTMTPKTVSSNKVASETSEVITVNFRTKSVVKTVEINNETGQVVSMVEERDVPPLFMGGGFGEIINILLNKKSNKGA